MIEEFEVVYDCNGNQWKITSGQQAEFNDDSVFNLVSIGGVLLNDDPHPYDIVWEYNWFNLDEDKEVEEKEKMLLLADQSVSYLPAIILPNYLEITKDIMNNF